MKHSLVDRIPAYVLGGLSEDEMRHMANIVAESPALAEEAALVQEALVSFATRHPPLSPSAAVRDRLLQTLKGVDRFQPFLDQLCKLVDLSEEVMRKILERIDDAGAWQPGPVPGLFLSHFQPGPRLAGIDAGFVRVTAGRGIPRHRHLGQEVALVLEGTLWQGEVGVFPGQPLRSAAGSVHALEAGTERDLVFAVTHCGIEIV